MGGVGGGRRPSDIRHDHLESHLPGTIFGVLPECNVDRDKEGKSIRDRWTGEDDEGG